MSLTIELPPAAQTELEKRAGESGTDPSTLASVLLQDSLRNLTSDDFPAPTPEEWSRMQDATRHAGASEERFRPWGEVKAEKDAKYGV